MSLKFTKTNFFLTKIHPFLARIPLYEYSLLRRKSYLRSTGWFKSFRTGKSVDQSGNPIPWFTYPVIDLLNERLPDNFTIFEYGCGLGTRWWASQAKRVDAVEHVKKWADYVSENMPDHVQILHHPLGKEYEQSISESGINYDIIVIDGRDRVKCCEASLPYISNRGIFIFDDTNRKKYQKGVQLLKDLGYRQLQLRGFSPIEFMECETSLFYKDGNILGL